MNEGMNIHIERIPSEHLIKLHVGYDYSVSTCLNHYQFMYKIT